MNANVVDVNNPLQLPPLPPIFHPSSFSSLRGSSERCKLCEETTDGERAHYRVCVRNRTKRVVGKVWNALAGWPELRDYVRAKNVLKNKMLSIPNTKGLDEELWQEFLLFGPLLRKGLPENLIEWCDMSFDMLSGPKEALTILDNVISVLGCYNFNAGKEMAAMEKGENKPFGHCFWCYQTAEDCKNMQIQSTGILFEGLKKMQTEDRIFLEALRCKEFILSHISSSMLICLLSSDCMLTAEPLDVDSTLEAAALRSISENMTQIVSLVKKFYLEFQFFSVMQKAKKSQETLTQSQLLQK